MTHLKIKCMYCDSFFLKRITEIKRYKKDFCSRDCYFKDVELNKQQFRKNNIFKCRQCNKEFYKSLSEQKKTKNNFCSLSCSATYFNAHKTKGTRVSKLELYLQEKLKELYEYNFHFNRKDTINSELDIYIPELKLAFELNGIFHYEPIFGEEKLNQIQNNDNRKFQACLEKGIELCIVDTSWIKNFKINNVNKILSIIVEIIFKNEVGGI